MLIAPPMSCSARLPVYVLLIGAFIPATPLLGGLIGLQAVTLLAFYFVGIGVAIPVALILKHAILKGEPQSFLMELPNYKWPSPRTVLYRVYEQGKVFCVSAGTIIFAVTVIVWALGYYPRPAGIATLYDARRATARSEHEQRLAALRSDADSADAAMAAVREAEGELAERLSQIDRAESGAYLRQSFLARMGHWIEPIVEPLGWDWRIGTAALAPFPAREVVVATMGTIYNLGEKRSEAPTGLRQKLRRVTWPDGRPVFNIAVALSIMVFFALCCQCGATLAAIKRETNSWRWPAFTFTYMTVLAYFAALITYQVAIRLI
jgi:ferrous iron transport protein B